MRADGKIGSHPLDLSNALYGHLVIEGHIRLQQRGTDPESKRSTDDDSVVN